MLTPVGLGQVRFTLPGLVPDARGVVHGRELCARFATLDRLVWFFRLLSGEAPPDELWLGLRIVHARSALGLREVLVLAPQSSSQAADMVARAARTAGGQCFTGTGKHHVQYRDARAPFGYDAREVVHEAADLVLYGADGVAGYRIEGETSLDRLIYGLELRRAPGALEATFPAGEGALAYVTARRGLGPRVIEHLHAAGVSAGAALCEPARAGAFGGAPPFWLFRVDSPPRRLLGLLARTPGLTLYAPVLDSVLVAAGFAHPLHLDACRALFKPDRLVLFPPPPATPILLTDPPTLVPLADLVPLRIPALGDAAPRVVTPGGPPPLELSLRLERVARRPGRAVAAWIPWKHAPWLRRLCYALPPTALRGHRMALLEPAILVLAGGDLAGLPFGQLLDEIGPGILAPVGTRLAPAVAPERVAERLGVGEGTLLVFPALGARPVRVTAGQLEPLERHVLAQARLDPERPALARRALPPVEQAPPPDVAHDPLGPWPLWGLER